MSASQIGVVFAAFGVGGVVAATTLGRVAAGLGYGRLLLAGYVVGALAITGLPFVTGSATVRTVLYVLLFFTAGCGGRCSGVRALAGVLAGPQAADSGRT